MRKNSTEDAPTVYEKIVSYDVRMEKVTSKNIRDYILDPNSTVPKNLQRKLLSIKNFELCVIAITSSGDLRGWQNSQCRILENFKLLNNKSCRNTFSVFLYLFIIVGYFFI